MASMTRGSCAIAIARMWMAWASPLRGQFGVGEEGEAAVGGEEGAEGWQVGAEPVGADFESEVGALEMLEDLGEGLVGRVEWNLERDGEGPPLHPGQGRVGGSFAGSIG
jgi:hypothetical protein